MSVKYPAFDGTQACVDADVEDFFYQDWDGEGSRKYKENKDFTNARNMCNNCPFLVQCFEWALHNEAYGFWGGTTEEERKSIRKKRNIVLNNPLKDILYVSKKNR